MSTTVTKVRDVSYIGLRAKYPKAICIKPDRGGYSGLLFERNELAKQVIYEQPNSVPNQELSRCETTVANKQTKS